MRQQEVKIQVVEAYQHLGRLTTGKLLLRPDMQMRAAQCMEALRPLIAKFFNVPELDMADKINIGRANIFSILCAGASSWHELNQVDIRCFTRRS